MQKTKYLILVISFFWFTSCNELTQKLGLSNKETQTEEEDENDMYLEEDDAEDSVLTKKDNKTENLSFHEELYATDESEISKKSESKEKLEIDTYSNEIAKFIAGIESEKYAEQQKKPFYETHKSAIVQAWEKTEGEDLEPITRWTRENMVAGSPEYNSTLFYPFSGPDILYANTFFPYARNYVLVGLENQGSLPHIEGLSNEMQNQYLMNIRSSQRYISKHGYFMTTHMQSDFSNTNLDGTIHLILYYLARTKHEILGIDEVAINNYGELTDTKNGNIRGIRVDFSNSDLKHKQSVYYFKYNLSNENIENNPGLLRFLKNQFSIQTYMKSASYILHDSHFSTVRDFVLDKSQKILQDDTGVPYYKFKGSKFDLQLFGNYSSTIKDFKNHFQPELKKALDQQETKHSLPFIVGYSSWLGETLLMYAKSSEVQNETLASNIEKETIKKETIKKEKTETKKIVTSEKQNNTSTSGRKLSYRVQILYSSSFYKEGSPEFKGLKNVSYYQDNGAYKYTIGDETSDEACLLLRKKARDAGFQDAFIIALFEGKRISLHQAEKISN